MILYCQGCDHSFTDQPVNASPQFMRCPECGGVHWATWKRGQAPPILDLSRMIPAPNANACAGGVAVTIHDFTGAAPLAIRLNEFAGPAPGAAIVSVIPFSGGTP